MSKKAKRETFGSRFAVVMAMAGAAVGLGNIWRFPYIAGEYGGSAFIIMYIVATVFISLPIFLAETAIGRRSGTSAYGAMPALAPRSRFWKFAGILTVIIPIVINSYYCVVGGWALDFLVQSCQQVFVKTEPEATVHIFGDFISQTWSPLIYAGVFLALSGIIIALGVRSGIEQFSSWAMPALFCLIVLIMGYSLSLPGSGEGLRYLLSPDFSQLTPKSFAYALGQSFFSLSLGMGAIITYGSYVRKDEDIVTTGAGTAVSDLLFAVLAGFAIMPAVFAAGIEPGAGPGLIFQSIPFVFSTMADISPVFSAAVSIVFFLTVVVAALTSSMCLFEVVVAYLYDKFGVRRPLGALLTFLVIGFLAIFSSLSFGLLGDVKIFGLGIFDCFDWVSSNILLILCGFFSVVFAGWVLKEEELYDELTNGGSIIRNVRIFRLVRFLMRWVCPVAVLLIFFTNFIF